MGMQDSSQLKKKLYMKVHANGYRTCNAIPDVHVPIEFSNLKQKAIAL